MKKDEMSGMKEWEREVGMGAGKKVTLLSSITPMHIKIPRTVAVTPVHAYWTHSCGSCSVGMVQI